MFYYIEGTVTVAQPGLLVLDCGGVGYELHVSANTLASAVRGAKFKAYTYVNVREDTFELYGFSTLSEKSCFTMLTEVSGVGPKAAMSILSGVTPDQLALGIISSDEKMLTSAPGIGKKLAQRVILELKDKLAKSLPDIAMPQGSPATYVSNAGSAAEAVGALMVLGYSRAEAEKAVSAVEGEALSVEETVRRALKAIG